jgi:Sigma-70, region 4
VRVNHPASSGVGRYGWLGESQAQRGQHAGGIQPGGDRRDGAGRPCRAGRGRPAGADCAERPATSAAVTIPPDAFGQTLAQAKTSASEDLEAAATGHPEGTPLAAALRQLSPDQREVLMLQLVGGLTAPEVATVLGMTVGQVKALRHRGQASLARALGLRSLDQLQERPWSLEPHHLANQEEH